MSGPEPDDGRSAPEGGYLDLREEWSAGGAPRSSASSHVGPQPRITGAATYGAPAPALEQSRRPGRPPKRVRGVARGVDFHYDEHRDFNTLSFRVDRYDAAGNRLDPVSVEMRHHRSGNVSEGDEVEVTGRPKRGTLIARRIINLTTGSEIRGGIPKGFKALPVLLLVLLVVGGGAFTAWSFVKHNGVKLPTLPATNASPQAPESPTVPATFPQPTVPAPPPSFVPTTEEARPTTTIAVSVPDVTNLKTADAESRLSAIGLRSEVLNRASNYPVGYVVATDPGAGSRVAPGSTIVLYVSSGNPAQQGGTATQTTTTASNTPTGPVVAP